MKRLPAFDYALAHKELVQPVVRQLNSIALAIYRDLRDAPEYVALQQAQTLLVPMPPELAQRFDAIPSPALALASHVLNAMGHWCPRGWTLDTDKPDVRGASWKFSNLADQVLRARLGVLYDSGKYKSSNGWRIELHEGMLRLCALSPDMWTSCEVCPATEAHHVALTTLRYTLPTYPSSRLRSDREEWDSKVYKITEDADALRAQLPPCDPPILARFLTAGKDYMREPGKGTGDCTECGADLVHGAGRGLAHESTCSQYPHARTAIESAESNIRYYMEKGVTVKDGARMLEGLRLLRESIGQTESMPRTAHDQVL